MNTTADKPEVEITYREARGCTIVGLNGPCDDACAALLGRGLDSLVEAGRKCLILDLSRTRYVETSGFRLILDRLSRLHDLGGQMVVTGLHSNVGRAFRLLKLDRFVPVSENVSSALDLLSERERRAS